MYYVARYYDPALGVFTQPDTIVPLASQGVQAWNRYAYVNDSPTNHVDPSGHACEDLPQGSREACINARERLDSPATSDPLPDEELTTVQKIGKGLTFTAVMVFIVAPTELALIDISIAAASSGPVGSVVDVLLLPVEITIADFAVSFGIKTYKEIESGQNVEFEWTILPALASDLPNPIQEELHKMLPRIFP
jgi:hypothetical protein